MFNSVQNMFLKKPILLHPISQQFPNHYSLNYSMCISPHCDHDLEDSKMTVRHNMNNTKYDSVSRQYDCVRHNMNRISLSKTQHKQQTVQLSKTQHTESMTVRHKMNYSQYEWARYNTNNRQYDCVRHNTNNKEYDCV